MDYHKFHLSGDLNEQVHGHVGSRITQFEMVKNTEELQQQLEEERENSRKLMEDVEHLRVQNELVLEKLKQQQWQAALEQLKENQGASTQEHQKCMDQIKETSATARIHSTNQALDWLKAQLGEPSPPDEEQEKARREQEERQ